MIERNHKEVKLDCVTVLILYMSTYDWNSKEASCMHEKHLRHSTEHFIFDAKIIILGQL